MRLCACKMLFLSSLYSSWCSSPASTISAYSFPCSAFAFMIKCGYVIKMRTAMAKKNSIHPIYYNIHKMKCASSTWKLWMRTRDEHKEHNKAIGHDASQYIFLYCVCVYLYLSSCECYKSIFGFVRVCGIIYSYISSSHWNVLNSFMVQHTHENGYK